MFQTEAEQDFPCNYSSTSYWATVQDGAQKLYFSHLLQPGSEKEEAALFKCRACKKLICLEMTGTRIPECRDRVKEEETGAVMVTETVNCMWKRWWRDSDPAGKKKNEELLKCWQLWERLKDPLSLGRDCCWTTIYREIYGGEGKGARRDRTD